MPDKAPHADAARLLEIERLDRFGVGPDPRFDRIAETARVALETPSGIVSLVGEQRLAFVGRSGVELQGVALEGSFCRFVLQADGAFMVEDARADARFRLSPLVSGPPYIRAYAGAAITLESGVRVGSVCVIDTEPRSWSDQDVRLLRHLAGLAADAIEGACLKNAAGGEGYRPLDESSLLSIAHDLRTPLNHIVGFADMLADDALGALPADRRESYLAIIRQSGAYMTELVEDVMRLERDRFDGRARLPGPVDLRALALAVASHFTGQAREKRLILDLSGCAENVHIDADELILRRILMNLIDNSCRHCRPGDTVSVGIAGEGPGRRYQVEVADTGPGAPHLTLAGDAAPARPSGRRANEFSRESGLGLGIVAALAKALGCRFSISPETGGGARAVLMCPA